MYLFFISFPIPYYIYSPNTFTIDTFSHDYVQPPIVFQHFP